MKIEFEDISHGKDRKDWTYDHDCTLKVKRTDDNGSVTETEEYGYMIQGEDMIFLNSENVYLPNLPTEHKDIAGAFDEVLGKLQDGGGGDDWQPPEWWIPVPEPEPYDIYILIQVENAGKRFDIQLGDQQGDTGMGAIHCDWGDGTEEDYGIMVSSPSHTYTETGQFLIHITGSENAFFLRYWNFNDAYNGSRDIVGLIIKTGVNIAFCIDYYDDNNYNYPVPFASKSFKYIKIMHPKGVPAEKVATGYFMRCHGLQKIELAKKISGELQKYLFQECYALKKLERFIDCDNVSKIGEFTFDNCYCLDYADFPNCTEVSKSAFYQCPNLIYAKMPNCAHIDDYAFQNCYNLQEITTADDCTYGDRCFQNCYSLYPRPDGSIN